MSDVPRKLLVVQRDPQLNPRDDGYNVMLEMRNRTMTLQVDLATGQEIMTRLQSVILEYAVQRGWVAPIQATARITNRKRRK